MRRISLAAVIPVALAALLAACATKHTTLSGALRLGATAEENYQRGVDELKDKNFPEAIRFFEYVKAKYPFSKVSVAADLRLADIKFAEGRYAEAAEAYEAYQKEHPSADELDYAEFRAGLSRFRAAPQDFFLLPPLEEKDQTETEKAVASLHDFLAKRPDSKYVPEAKKTLAAAENLLAKREMFVGDFYFKREIWGGAAGRYKGLVDRYPESPLVSPALWKLAHTYVRLDQKFLARQALQRLITQHPESRDRAEAEKLLESLR
jgi:outer membrane protein assembly factor BamD